MNLGDTFIWQPKGSPKEHLYIIVTDPNKDADGKFVAFNLTKSNGGAKALTFKIGDHPYITKYPSDINFGDGLVTSVKTIQEKISNYEAFPSSPMTPAQIKRIVDFSKNHPAVSGEVEDMILAQWP